MNNPHEKFAVKVSLCDDDVDLIQMAAARQRDLSNKQREPNAIAIHRERAERLDTIAREVTTQLHNARRKRKR